MSSTTSPASSRAWLARRARLRPQVESREEEEEDDLRARVGAGRASFGASIGASESPGRRRGRRQGRHPKTRACSEDMVEILHRAGQQPVRLGTAEGCDQTDAEEESSAKWHIPIKISRQISVYMTKGEVKVEIVSVARVWLGLAR
jgi:hypothetical protein